VIDWSRPDKTDDVRFFGGDFSSDSKADFEDQVITQLSEIVKIIRDMKSSTGIDRREFFSFWLLYVWPEPS
jgi:hypothetical protein